MLSQHLSSTGEESSLSLQEHSGKAWVYNFYTVRTQHLSPVIEIDSKYEHRPKLTDDFSSFAPQLEVRWCLSGSVKMGNK